MLIAEDLALLLMDDESGTPAAAGTLHYTTGGAVLVELALAGLVEVRDKKVLPVGTAPEDPLLRLGYEKVADKPRSVDATLLRIGSGLWQRVVDRLVDKGFVRREEKRVLGLFRTTRLPAEDVRHEEEVRQRIRAVLVDGEDADPRTAALVALLSASGALPLLRPPLAWSGEVHRRAKDLERGNWGAAAVGTAVARTAAAIAASTAAATVVVVTAVT
ncbi:GOLPH3/VPS74 family protein [Umezawaea tangerina]|uniref:Golgi phosphoprotein 3 GPP34 n=1 Tax=Umezawaea tangerina TaxID=84725 RepID=A0A2T0T740_9PSEU|nr:GPP34 family phosphoprotein [Umezawaea tangerina]PRY41453.1 Golgi phosphoprotein 3 GPP34 [Umezawaea tangerina]